MKIFPSFFSSFFGACQFKGLRLSRLTNNQVLFEYLPTGRYFVCTESEGPARMRFLRRCLAANPAKETAARYDLQFLLADTDFELIFSNLSARETRRFQDKFLGFFRQRSGFSKFSRGLAVVVAVFGVTAAILHAIPADTALPSGLVKDFQFSQVDLSNSVFVASQAAIALPGLDKKDATVAPFLFFSSLDPGCKACATTFDQIRALPTQRQAGYIIPSGIEEDLSAAKRTGLAYCSKDPVQGWASMLHNSQDAHQLPAIDPSCQWIDRAKLSTLFTRTFDTPPAYYPLTVAPDGAAHYGAFESSQALGLWLDLHQRSGGGAK